MEEETGRFKKRKVGRKRGCKPEAPYTSRGDIMEGQEL